MRALSFRALAAIAAVVGMGAFEPMPDLGQQRTLSSRPGSGLVKRAAGGRPRRRDGARQAAAQAKRERKNAKRRRDALRGWCENRCSAPFPLIGVPTWEAGHGS